MIQLFKDLIGSVGNTWQDTIFFFFCCVMLIFTLTSFLQFLSGLFKKD